MKFRSLNKLFILLVIIMCSLKSEAAETAYRTTQSHTQLTQEESWLNTSRKITADDLAGRIILVDFWTFCCINCIQIIPDLHAIENQFGDKITVVGVHSAKFANEKDSSNILNAILRYDIEHPVVNDSKFKIWNSFAVNGWPTLILIGQDGLLKKTYSGEGNKEKIIADINELVARGNYRTDKLPVKLEKDKTPSGVLEFPSKIVTGEYKNEKVIFVSNSGKDEIIAVNKAGNIIKHFKGDFNKPQGLLYGNSKIYVADTGNHKLKVVDLNTDQVLTLAGTGERGSYRKPSGDPTKTALASPWDLAFYPDENHIAVANAGTHQIWSYNLQNKSLDILAGNGREFIDDGAYPENSLSQPSGLSVLGNKLYFVDSETSSLRVLENGKVITLIGTGLFDFGYKEGKQGKARFQHPLGILAKEDKVYIADSYNHAIRTYDPKTGEVKNLLGNGKPGELNEPNDILDWDGVLYIANTNNNNILKVQNGKLVKFTITETEKPIAQEKPEDLPNLIVMKPIRILGKAPLFKLNLRTGWHVNADAPSYLNLFKDGKQVQAFDKEALKTGIIKLKPLMPGKYILQGTIYHCEDKTGSECLINSINQEITADSDAKLDEITISF